MTDRIPDLIVDGHQRLTATVFDRDPNEPDDYAAVALNVTVPVTLLLNASQARRLAARLADYADEVDQQNRA